MDIDLLAKMVGELILDNDEVSLPGVGTFVAEVMPSSFSDKGYTINPPYRKLSFRQREKSDGLLVALYARANGVYVQTASSILEKFLAELRETLKVRKTVIFPGLGRLRATRENNFFFIPDEDLNIYPEGFGLEPLSLKTHVETEDDMRAAVASLQQILDEPAPVAEAVPASEERPAEQRPAEQTPAVEVVPESAESVEEIVPEEVKPVENVVPETRGKGRRWWIVAASIVAAAVLLLVVFVVLARIAPDFVDSILYTEEELDIIRQI
jgi:nucleoid DNA-binding protein